MNDQMVDQLQRELERTQELDSRELEADRRRVKSLVSTKEGREALRQELGYNFLFADDALSDGRALVSLICPTRSNPAAETNKSVDAMLRASRPYCIITPQPGISSSIVHWARNDLLVNLRKSKTPTDYVLMMDDDMVPPEDGLIKLLKHDADIVAGGCTVRKDPPIPNFRVWVPELFSFRTAFDWPRNQTIEVGGVGAAFMLIKTTVFDKLGEYYLSCRYEREHLCMKEDNAKLLEEGRRKVAQESGNEWWFQFLMHPWGDGEFGEDLSFCFKARECGLKILVDTSVKPGHIGSYAYTLDDYYSYQAEIIQREMAKGMKHEQLINNAATGRLDADDADRAGRPTNGTARLEDARPQL